MILTRNIIYCLHSGKQWISGFERLYLLNIERDKCLAILDIRTVDWLRINITLNSEMIRKYQWIYQAPWKVTCVITVAD